MDSVRWRARVSVLVALLVVALVAGVLPTSGQVPEVPAEASAEPSPGETLEAVEAPVAAEDPAAADALEAGEEPSPAPTVGEEPAAEPSASEEPGPSASEEPPPAGSEQAEDAEVAEATGLDGSADPQEAAAADAEESDVEPLTDLDQVVEGSPYHRVYETSEGNLVVESFADPVLFQNEQQQWEPIDLRVDTQSDGGPEEASPELAESQQADEPVVEGEAPTTPGRWRSPIRTRRRRRSTGG